MSWGVDDASGMSFPGSPHLLPARCPAKDFAPRGSHEREPRILGEESKTRVEGALNGRRPLRSTPASRHLFHRARRRTPVPLGPLMRNSSCGYVVPLLVGELAALLPAASGGVRGEHRAVTRAQLPWDAQGVVLGWALRCVEPARTELLRAPRLPLADSTATRVPVETSGAQRSRAGAIAPALLRNVSS